MIGGTIITGFEWRGTAEVKVTVEAGPIRLGRFPSGLDEGVQQLIELFRRAGLRVESSESIRRELWAKTLYNCALNPLGAIMDVPYGQLADSHSWSIIQRVIEEAFAVCEAEEAITLRWDSAAQYLDYLRAMQLPATADHHSSMLQDIRQGRKTEIDFMNGAVVRLGRRHGIATTTKVYQHLKFFQYACQLEVRVPRVRLPDGTLCLIKPPWAEKLAGITLFQRGSKRLHRCGRLFRDSSIQHALDRGPSGDYSIPPAPPV